MAEIRDTLTTTPPQTLPTRLLGETGLPVPVLGLGTGCFGNDRTMSHAESVTLCRQALDEGITLFDCARAYEKAEAVLGEALAGHWDEVMVTTKAGGNTATQVQASFEESLRQLKHDRVDLLFLHNAGGLDIDQALAPGGSVEYLLRQKELGRCRFVGATSHERPGRLRRLVEAGVLDFVMMVLNFTDRWQYDFEHVVLPAARERGVGVLAMKVFGGLRGQDWSRYAGPNPGPQVDENELSFALRYALSLDGVAGAVVGAHTIEQVRQNIARAQKLQPLSGAEQQRLAQLGQSQAPSWGLRFGPVD